MKKIQADSIGLTKFFTQKRVLQWVPSVCYAFPIIEELGRFWNTGIG